MKIQTSDGYIFEGADAKEIVRKMRDTQWGTPVLKRDYMEEVKDRVGTSATSPIVHDKGADAFLTSLAENGLIVIKSANAEYDAEFNARNPSDDDEPRYFPDERD